MSRFKVLLASALIVSASAFSQQKFDYSVKYSWKEVPEKHTIKKQFDSSSAICILDERKIEYKVEKEDIPIYESYHKIVRVQNDRGIELFNKVYIPLYQGYEVVEAKARSISANGTVVNVDVSKAKIIEEDGTTYKIFAIDGLEKNAEVEYAYTLKRPFSVFGSEFFQNGTYPTQEVNFALITPKHLVYSVKGYNGLEVSEDSLIDDKYITVSSATDIPDLDNEKYAYKDKYLKRIDYKLSYNLSNNGKVRMYTWKEFAKRVFANMTTRSEKDEKALDKFIKEIKIKDGATDAEKIASVEDYIKKNINIDKKLISKGSDVIETIVKNKASDHEGAVKLFMGVFDKLNINCQLVLPSDRTNIPLDEDLEDWNRVDDYLFYFPSTHRYITPINIDYRYPYIPFSLAATRGLFLKTTEIGTFKTAVGVFGNVDIEPFESSAQNMDVSVKFNETLDTLLVKSKQILKGYGGAEYRPIFTLPKDRQDEITKDIIKNVTGSTNYDNVKIENSKLTDCFTNDKPLIIGADIKSTELIENAGSKILLKIGEIIGPQVEMYQEKPRQLPIELDYPHVLNRTVTITIPDGYAVKNINDLNADVSFKENDKVTMGFVSSFKQTGNVIELEIDETYRLVNYPKEQFENFKKVINASADFNKVVLVLEKK
jgi:hypothetical protein